MPPVRMERPTQLAGPACMSTGRPATMRAVRWLGLLLVLAVVAVPSTAAATLRASSAGTLHGSNATICTAFGKTWAKKYNAAPGPVRIVTICCGLPSVRTHLSSCKMMITGRKGGMGDGMFGCGVATVSPTGNVLANKPLDCVRATSAASLRE